MKLSLKDIKQAVRKPAAVAQSEVIAHFDYFQSSPLDLTPFRVRNDLWIVPNYLTPETEADVLERGVNAQSQQKWVTLRNRSLQMWGGEVTPAGLMNKEPLPLWLEVFAQRLLDEGVFPMKPNHVLINRYARGDGIMPHTDGPAYFPLVAIVSMGAPTVFTFWSVNPRQPEFALVIPQRSLLLFTDACYQDKMHGIEATPGDSFYTDECGKVYTQNEGFLCEVLNYADESSISEPSSLTCPQCAGPLNLCSVMYRDLRVSFTIRYVNE